MKICVVGAGASGLPAIKTCLENGFQVVCYEKSTDIAGLWRYKPKSCPGEGTVMKSTVINTSKEMTAYSDFVPPAEAANYMHNSEMLSYFRSYAEHFHLLRHIKFEHEVVRVARNDRFNETGQWDIIVRDLKEGQTVKQTYDAVMLCSGHHTVPYWPEPFPGQENYLGEILHGHDYRDPLQFADKNVVVVGIGNSGGDIAVELSKIAKQVYIATRSGSWVMNRIWDRGEPVDVVFINRFVHAFEKILPWPVVNWVVEHKISQRFDHGRYGLKPKHRVLQAHATVNDELPNRIASGTVIVKPNIGTFAEWDVTFEDGTVVRNVDTVIFATGYSFDFAVVEDGNLIPVVDNQVTLYQYMYPPELSSKNSLAVIGLIQPWGSIMPISEMQCRLFCEVLAGRCKLPDIKEMLKNIEKKKTRMAKQYVKRRRHTIQVNYADYMDELSKLIGVKPNLLRYWLIDPRLAYTLSFQALAPYQYRLVGPNAWNGAREALLGMKLRTFDNTRTRRTKETMKSTPVIKFLYLFRLLNI